MGNSFSLLTGIQKVWKNAARLFMQRDDSGLPSSSFSSASFVAGSVLSLILLQGCAGQMQLQVNQPSDAVPKDFTCVPISQVQKLHPELDMSFVQDFPASSTIIAEAEKTGVLICTSPNASDYLNPQLGNRMRERHSNEGVVIAAYFQNYHAVLTENIPLEADAFLHEILHAIQLYQSTQNIDLKMKTLNAVSVKTLQSTVVHDAGTMAMHTIMEYRRNQRVPNPEREAVLLDENNPNVIPQLYRFLTERIKEDPSLVKQMGNAQEMPSDEILDQLMSHFVGKASELYVMSPIRTLSSYAKKHPEVPVDYKEDTYSQDQVAATTLGPLRKGGRFPLTKEMISQLSEEMSSAFEASVKVKELDGATVLKKMRPLNDRFSQLRR